MCPLSGWLSPARSRSIRAAPGRTWKSRCRTRRASSQARLPGRPGPPRPSYSARRQDLPAPRHREASSTSSPVPRCRCFAAPCRAGRSGKSRPPCQAQTDMMRCTRPPSGNRVREVQPRRRWRLAPDPRPTSRAPPLGEAVRMPPQGGCRRGPVWPARSGEVGRPGRPARHRGRDGSRWAAAGITPAKARLSRGSGQGVLRRPCGRREAG